MSDGLTRPVRRVHGGRAAPNPVLVFTLCMVAVTAVAAVLIAAAMGESTVALAIGLVSAAFFAGMIC